MWIVDIHQGITLVATTFFFEDDTGFIRSGSTAGTILADVHNNTYRTSTSPASLSSDSAARGL